MEYCKNQLHNVTITDIGESGEGIGRVNGYTLFVKDALVGDVIRARLTKVKKNYAFARIEEILEPSENRVEPKCELHRKCGGCQIQALSYPAQLDFKTGKVLNSFTRLGGFCDENIQAIIEPIIGADNPYRYRNKAQYPIGRDKEGHIIAGFYAGRTHSIIKCDDCMIGIAENKAILQVITSHMERYNITAYDETTGVGLVRHVLIRKGFKTGQIMVCLVINGKVKSELIPYQNELIESLSRIEGMSGISVSINRENTNVIMGNEIYTIWGEERITDVVLGKKFSISPLAFFQVNPAQMEKLYTTAIDFAGLNGAEEVWDICCGIGTITLCMAAQARKVHGLEIVPEAIEDAKENARLNGIENADFVCAPAEKYLPENAERIRADVIVLDPPRKGMEKEALEVVVNAAPERVVYVSCDPATLARDCRFMCDRGYEIKRIRPVDMFPNTVHVETVCLLINQNAQAKHHVNVGLDAEDYYKIKEGK